MKKFDEWVKIRDKKLYEDITQDEFGDENSDKKKELIVLIGPPAVGKSTYIASKFKPDDVFVVSRDDIVDQVAGENNFTYDDMFELPPPDTALRSIVVGKEKFGVVKEAPVWMKWTKLVYSKIQDANERINNLLQQRFSDAVDSGKNIVVDMTNMTASARKNSLKYADKKDYFRRAVVFTLNDSDLPALLKRMRDRSEEIKQKGGSKTIGDDVVNRMIASFEKVKPEEGFDKIETINNFRLN